MYVYIKILVIAVTTIGVNHLRGVVVNLGSISKVIQAIDRALIFIQLRWDPFLLLAPQEENKGYKAEEESRRCYPDPDCPFFIRKNWVLALFTILT